MIKKTLLLILAFLIVIFIFLWIWTGGLSKTWQAAQTFPGLFNFLRGATSTITGFQLPWQMQFPTGASISPAGDGNASVERDTESFEGDYENLRSEITEAQNFGTPSPFRGRILIVGAGATRESDPAREYIEIAARADVTAPVAISGWSLQSAYTGVRAYIPRAVRIFAMGVVNRDEPIQLDPGSHAIVNSGVSPVGVSLRENICTGYLEQFQGFAPPLPNSCPIPGTLLSMTAGNLRTYGESCFDFLESVPQCTSPLSNIPPDLSPNCRAFVLNNLSYNGCVNMNQSRAVFLSDTWRVYLGGSAELWSNRHDVIRLLDAEGRTVDAITY
ncbi:MAG: hypothetical protein UY63_C0017G0075 [Parcubacteria group bacterium GW2011_GWA2_51_10]|nr:MAG: hypothetical protein UY63_C0017G0075 [Parcubacteria group bacterium GW2011_GWA2_51_10]